MHRILAPLRVIGRFARMVTSPRRLLDISLPARVAYLLAFFLVLCAILAYVAFAFSDDVAARATWYHPSRIAIIIGLVIAIPVVVYRALLLWLEGDPSDFPDIDEAWDAGVAALEENGLLLDELPIFLVLGADSPTQMDTLMGSVGWDLVVSGAPNGRAPLRWYGNDRCIVLACTGTGCLGSLNQGGVGGDAGAVSGSRSQIVGTLVPGGGGITDTALPTAATGGAPSAPQAGIRGTLVLGADSTEGHVDRDATVHGPTGQGGGSLSHRQAEEESARLRHVCRRLRRARQPLCPLNGLLVLFPLPVLKNILSAQDMPRAVRRDLATIHHETSLFSPVTVLVTGMEQEPGFSELVRRVGLDRAKAHRFGKGLQVGTRPSAENLEALTWHACGAFEDWVYSLFREPDGLNKPGNSKLYGLLCAVRREVQTRLQTVLLHGFSNDQTEDAESAPKVFAGCYFAATGPSDDRQAFVKSVFEKMLDLEEEVEWSEMALVEDDRHYRASQVVMFLLGLLVVALGALGWLRFSGPSAG